MASKSRFFQSGFPATLLRSAALTIALIVQASPVRAEPVTLSCQVDKPSMTLTLRINYTTGLVERLAPSGSPYTNMIAPNARISANAIVWSVKFMDTDLQPPAPMLWEGTIDRLSGTGLEKLRSEDSQWSQVLSFTCREATKPKF